MVNLMDMQAFADALASKDLGTYSAWFADDVSLYVPIHEEPRVGKETACQILPVVFTEQQSHALVFRAEVTGIPLEGVDYVRTDENGLVTEFSVTMRPLRAITALSKAIDAELQSG